jgi:hypothetical protein
VQPLNASSGTVPDFAGNYWSHAVFDRWGVYASYSDTNGAYVGAGVWDIKNSTRTAFPASDDSGTQYHAWNGWSDYTVHTLGNGGATSDWIGIQKYDGGTDLIYLSDGHWFETPNENTKPAQSPDGTKVGYRSDWLITSSARSGDSGYSTSDLHIVTAYYPFPPEIISVTSGVVRFGWETDVVSRGYTERGWPDESTDDPPPPRETKEFRLWKSTNGTTGWIPVGTVTASIFDRYNFATGIWSGLDYWEITDPSPSGYYAVTSIEHSGLESRTLSNVFSAAGSQTAAYPADPGSDDNIISAYNSDCHRYYNIYAEDGSTPTISQVNRIASDPRTNKSFVDWLGNTSGTTQYIVTAVDTQGNESSAVSSSVTHKQSPATADGQYTITWSDGESSTPNQNCSFSCTVK